MRYGIIGVGAVGGYYGALLARCGFDVHFLLHSDYTHVKEKGLVVESVNGDFLIPQINAYSRPEDMPQCDVVIIALKTTQNSQLKNILPHVVKKGGTIVLLQNGIGVEQDIAQIAPDATIIGGLCFLCSTKTGPGHIKHMDYGAITLGEYRKDGPAGITDTLHTISHAFTTAGISMHLSENLGLERWKKLVWNTPFSGLTVILDATTEELMADASSRSLLYEIMIEVINGAKKCGYHIDRGFADEMFKRTEKMVAYKPSMKLDFEQGRAMEINEIYWRPIQEAEAKGFHMAKTRAIALELDFLEQRNRKKHKI